MSNGTLIDAACTSWHLGLPTRGFTVAVSVSGGTPPGKPLVWDSWVPLFLFYTATGAKWCKVVQKQVFGRDAEDGLSATKRSRVKPFAIFFEGVRPVVRERNAVRLKMLKIET